MIEDTSVRMARTPLGVVEHREERSFLRWAGWSGLIASVAFVASILINSLAGLTGPDGAGDMVRYLDDLAKSAWSPLSYGIAGVVLSLLYIPMAVGIYRLLGRTTTAWYGSGAVIAGLAVLMPAYVIAMVSWEGLAPLAEASTGGGVPLYLTYEMLARTADAVFIVGSLLSLGIGTLLWGVAWIRSTSSSRWLGWTALIAGITGMVWLAMLVDSPIVVLTMLANVLLSLIFFVGASAVLLSRGRAA